MYLDQHLYGNMTKKIMFTLVIDDFVVKFTDKQDAQHLVEALKDLYPITASWIGNKYLGITLTWDYRLRQVDISIPGYITVVLLKKFH